MSSPPLPDDEMIKLTITLRRDSLLTTKIDRHASIDGMVVSTLLLGMLQRAISIFAKESERRL